MKQKRKTELLYEKKSISVTFNKQIRDYILMNYFVDQWDKDKILFNNDIMLIPDVLS